MLRCHVLGVTIWKPLKSDKNYSWSFSCPIACHLENIFTFYNNEDNNNLVWLSSAKSWTTYIMLGESCAWNMMQWFNLSPVVTFVLKMHFIVENDNWRVALVVSIAKSNFANLNTSNIERFWPCFLPTSFMILISCLL